MINDHVDLIVEFADRKMEMEGLEHCCEIFFNIYDTVEELPFWVEFCTGGAMFGLSKTKVNINFPIEEQELWTQLKKLIIGELF